MGVEMSACSEELRRSKACHSQHGPTPSLKAVGELRVFQTATSIVLFTPSSTINSG